jgi:hypothetical protein
MQTRHQHIKNREGIRWGLFRAMDLGKLETVFTIMEERSSNIKLIRTLLMPFVPNHLNTSAGSINNIRMRVNDVRKAGCTFDSPQAHATLSCKGLDKGEMADFATESALTMSRECLREVLQNLEQSWKVEACLQKMKDTDPYFDF